MNSLVRLARIPTSSLIRRGLQVSTNVNASQPTKLEPLFDRVLVKKVEAETLTKGGIMVPEGSSKAHTGTVVAVGSGARNRDGDFHKPVLKAGDQVMLPEYGGNKVEIEGETHFVYRESDIIGRWKP